MSKTIPCVYPIEGCSIVTATAMLMIGGLAQIAAILDSCSADDNVQDLSGVQTGDNAVTISIAAGTAKVPCVMIQIETGADSAIGEIQYTFAGSRPGSVPGTSIANSFVVTVRIHQAGRRASFLVFPAQTAQGGEYYPVPFILAYHASTPLTLVVTPSGGGTSTIHKVIPTTNGSRYFDDTFALVAKIIENNEAAA